MTGDRGSRFPVRPVVGGLLSDWHLAGATVSGVPLPVAGHLLLCVGPV